MKRIHNILAPLASFEAQDRYIVNGTAEFYLLPNDLLSSAFNFFFEQKVIEYEDSAAIREFKDALRHYDYPEEISNRELVFHYEPWINLRNKAKRVLDEMGFNLQAWEKKEL
jgi:hypothetical protein